MVHHRSSVVAMSLVVALFAGCSSSTVAPPRSPSLCKDVIAMPCLSGRVCVEVEEKGCQICKCLAPPLPPLDQPWMATGTPSAATADSH